MVKPYVLTMLPSGHFRSTVTASRRMGNLSRVADSTSNWNKVCESSLSRPADLPTVLNVRPTSSAPMSQRPTPNKPRCEVSSRCQAKLGSLPSYYCRLDLRKSKEVLEPNTFRYPTCDTRDDPVPSCPLQEQMSDYGQYPKPVLPMLHTIAGQHVPLELSTQQIDSCYTTYKVNPAVQDHSLISW